MNKNGELPKTTPCKRAVATGRVVNIPPRYGQEAAPYYEVECPHCSGTQFMFSGTVGCMYCGECIRYTLLYSVVKPKVTDRDNGSSE